MYQLASKVYLKKYPVNICDTQMNEKGVGKLRNC